MHRTVFYHIHPLESHNNMRTRGQYSHRSRSLSTDHMYLEYSAGSKRFLQCLNARTLSDGVWLLRIENWETFGSKFDCI